MLSIRGVLLLASLWGTTTLTTQAFSVPSQRSCVARAAESPLFLLSSSKQKLGTKKQCREKLYLSEETSSAPVTSGDNGGEEAGPPPAFLLGVLGALLHFVSRFLLKGVPQLKIASRVLLAGFMIGGSLMRTDPETVKDVLVPMVPPPLPARLCVYLSGIVEAMCGVLLLIPSTISQGAKLTFLLLLGVFPANIYHAFSDEAKKNIKITASDATLQVRLILQLVFMYWAAWYI